MFKIIEASGTSYQLFLWSPKANTDFENLYRRYDDLTNQLDALIHIDTTNPMFVYQWRLEQEASLRSTKGSGMTDRQVFDFVNGCKPPINMHTNIN